MNIFLLIIPFFCLLILCIFIQFNTDNTPKTNNTTEQYLASKIASKQYASKTDASKQYASNYVASEQYASNNVASEQYASNNNASITEASIDSRIKLNGSLVASYVVNDYASKLAAAQQ